MPISNRSDSLRWLTSNGVTSRTAVYGPVRTVVWQGSAGNRRPYADHRISAFAALLLCGVALDAQAPKAAPISFDVISVKPNNSDNPAARANFPLGPGDVYVTNGGHFTATDFPLLTYINFAYKLQGNEMEAVASQLPGWAAMDRFDILAQTDGDPAKDTKDQMRLMMRSLLAERFKLATHYETRQVPVFAVVLAKAGKTGSQIRQHVDAEPCTVVYSAASTPAPTQPPAIAGGYPTQCGGLLLLPSTTPGRLRAGARNVTMGFIANQITAMGGLGRVAVDQTGLSGTFDFWIEWVPEIHGSVPVGSDFQPDPTGPSFMEALRDQLGLKLDSQKGPAEFLIIDHVEHPSEN